MAEVLVKKKDMVTIYGTGENKHMPAGKKFTEHAVLAETLIKKGFASKTPVEVKPSKGGKKDDK